MAATAVTPATANALIKTMGSKNHVNEPKSRLPAEGTATSKIGVAG